MYVKTGLCYIYNKTCGAVAQSIMCLTADPGVRSSILNRFHTFVEIDQEIISMAILLPNANLKKGCSQLQAKLCTCSTGSPLCQTCPGKSVVGELTSRHDHNY